MTQPNLLKLAQQGEPNAIATLINLALEPKGVIAKAAIEDDCLYVFLRSARPLNAKALVAFIQRGILRLEIDSIERVQVYGQHSEDEHPLWVETFVIQRSRVAEGLEAQVAEALEALSHTPTGVIDNSPPKLVTPGEGQQQWARALPLQASLNSTFKGFKEFLAQQRDRLKREPSDHARTKRRPLTYLKLSVLVTLAAFVTGGAVALLANSFTVGKDDRKQATSTTAAGSQLTIKSEAERTRNQQQDAARNYLETMNKAQQTFYRQNNRFASTLEELERFAAVPIASRSDYTYKLTVPSKTQAQLTAMPKPEGLKSYTAAVAIVKPTNQAVAAICASQQAAKVPPLIFLSSEGIVQCPAEPAKAP
ncbi:MAG: type IV pilin-like G/H family protein [Tildeniella nuda ZEHNDER 1965/U140]|jgi:type II secretory pathway pseudopilin PulG|nr:type IV pilin-like G/H family protein [Tildeniella nuda ZEHNDER 1965/U140]